MKECYLIFERDPEYVIRSDPRVTTNKRMALEYAISSNWNYPEDFESFQGEYKKARPDDATYERLSRMATRFDVFTTEQLEELLQAQVRILAYCKVPDYTDVLTVCIPNV